MHTCRRGITVDCHDCMAAARLHVEAVAANSAVLHTSANHLPCMSQRVSVHGTWHVKHVKHARAQGRWLV